MGDEHNATSLFFPLKLQWLIKFSLLEMAPPVLRGFVQRHLRNAILRSIAIGTAGGVVWMYGYAEPKRKKYEEFYKNYDAEKVAKEMEAEMEALE